MNMSNVNKIQSVTTNLGVNETNKDQIIYEEI